MRKATAMLLAAAFVAAGGQVAKAADRAGLGLEWTIGPSISLSGFDLKMDQEFGVSWAVSDSFSVNIFRHEGSFRGEHTYSDNVSIAGQTVDQTVILNGTQALSGLQFLAGIPFLNFVKFRLGAELGVQTLNGGVYSFQRGDGAATDDTAFGMGAAGDLQSNWNDMTLPEIGVLARLSLLSAETKTVTTSLDVAANLRFVSIPDTWLFGTQDSNTTKAVPDKIDAVTSYNTFAVQAGINVGF